MPQVRLEVELRRRTRSGGLFRKELWEAERLTATLQVGDTVKLAPDLLVRVEEYTGGVCVRGKLNGVDCILGDIPYGRDNVNLKALSVAARNLSGKAELI